MDSNDENQKNQKSPNRAIVIKGTKSVLKTWPCFILTDQGFWLLILVGRPSLLQIMPEA